MIKAVLFDLDGTIIDTNDLIIKSYRHTLKKHLGLEAKDEELVMTFGEPLAETLEKFSKDKYKELMESFRDFNESRHDELAREVYGAKETMAELRKRGIKLGVVTSKRKIMAERGLKLFNLLNYMDVVITPEDTVEHKPKGEPALKACELLGVQPEEAILIGDSYYDILCGKNAGTQTALVKYTALPLNKLLKYEPDFVVEKLMDITDLIDKQEKIKAEA